MNKENNNSTLIPLVLVLIGGIIAMYMGVLPKRMVGGMCPLLPLGLIIGRFSDWLSVWRTFMATDDAIHVFK